MNLRKMIALLLCVLMLAAFTACTGTPANSGEGDVPPMPTQETQPTAKDATDSVFLGTWNVSENENDMDTLTFNQNGILTVTFNGHTLGGVFYDDGVSKFDMIISRKEFHGTYTVEGDTITIVTETETLVLTKVQNS